MPIRDGGTARADESTDPASEGRRCLSEIAVTIVIPTWMRAEYLRGCLASLARQTLVPSEVLVVGRAADETARAVVDRATMTPAPRWLEIDVPGHLPPVRRGLDEAEGEIVAFLDDDAEPEPGWLKRLIYPFRDPRVVCVGGRFLGARRNTGPSIARVQDAGRLTWYGAFRGHMGDLPGLESSRCDGVIEGNSAWRKDVLASLKFEPIFEKDDSLHYGLSLGLQARERGFEVVYAPGARAYHHWAPRAGVRRDDRVARAYVLGRNLTYIWLRHYRGWRRVAFPVWWWLVGERHSYGVAKALVDLMLKGTQIWPAVRAGMRGRAEGIRAWRAARSSGIPTRSRPA
jgi:GT2 family glycosyltransferase